MTTVVKTGRLELADRAASPFLYLPFEVPPGANRIEVNYRFDKGNILDLGLFDPELDDFPSDDGFRGWSGGARSGFFVSCDEATPGYIPGPLPAGTWHVVLGLAALSKEGCRYRVEIEIESGDCRNLESLEVASLPKRPAGWYRGDLQSHSYHSDAQGSLEDLVRAAKAKGLEFLAVTDHNTVSHHRRLPALNSPELLLIPGQEITTYRGHANVWGADGWVDFRIGKDDDVTDVVAQAHRRGGLFSVNHPKTQPNCIGCDWTYREVPTEADCFEAWQGPWLNRNWESLERYDALLRRGRRLTLVGGSDRHQPGWPDTDPSWLQVGSPTTWLYLEDFSVQGVLDAIRAGRAFVSESPKGPHLDLRVNSVPMGSRLDANAAELRATAHVEGAAGDTLRWVDRSGTVREVSIDSSNYEDSFVWTPNAFLRAEIVAVDRTLYDERAQMLEQSHQLPPGLTLDTLLRQPCIRALANPIYISS